MIIECQNCGAPLDVESSSTYVACRYCQSRNKVKETKTLMQVTPANWQQPTQWSGAERDAAQKALALAAGGAAISTGASSCVFVIVSIVIVIVMLAVGGFLFAFRTASNVPGGLPVPTPGVSSWNGAAPFTCAGNEMVTIDGVTANLPNDVAISADINCRVVVRNSTIRARVGVEGRGNGEIRLQNSTIEGTQAGVRVEGNRQLTLDNSEVRSQGVGVSARNNAQVVLQGGKVEGRPAVTTQHNARLENAGGVVVDL